MTLLLPPGTWHERRTRLPEGDPRKPKESTKMTYDELKRRFRIVKTSLISLPRNLSRAPVNKPLTGDCQDFAKTAKAALGLKWYQGIMVRCWSPQNWRFPFLPRHAALWVFGQGFVDSTFRDFRKTPWPCIPIWPVGTPLIAGIVWGLGLWRGWWGVDWMLRLIP